MFKKYLLSSAAMFAPPDVPGATPGPDNEDERIEVDLDDDEVVQDPIDEPEAELDADADDPDADDDDGGEQPPARQPSRGDRQVGALRAENRRIAEENARITRQLDELRRSPPAPVAAVETPAQRAERFALMSPDERTEAIVSEALQRNQQQNQQLTSQIMDQSDSVAFQAQTAVNPLLKKLAPEVELRLADLRSKGQNLPRSVVATYLIGERVMAQQGKAKPGAQQRRRAQDTRPANGRGDVSGERRRQRGGNSAADMERDFGDVPI